VLEELATSIRFNIEIKEDGFAGDGSCVELARVLSSMGLSGRCIVSSFNPASLRRLASACCVPTGLLYPTDGAGGLKDRLTQQPWLAALLPVYALHPREDRVDAQLVRRAHLRGLAVNTWTVNDPARMRELFDLGVNGLITDRPDLALDLLAELDPDGGGQ
jgi:glycerophosphoryl diester phosphodiesterase